MISWRSFTTSKVLPTFVGESISTASRSFSRTRASGFDFAGRFVNDATETSSRSDINSPSLTYFAAQGGATNGLYSITPQPGGGFLVGTFNEYVKTGELENNGEAIIFSTIVTKNSTIEAHYGITRTSPLATIRQETTKTESFESFFRTSKTLDFYEDDEGNSEPFPSFVWTTTVVGNGTNAKTTFDQITTFATETIQDFKTREGKRTVIITIGSPIEVTTYTAMDGNVEVVAHTIWLVNSNTFAASVNAVNETPVTNLSFAANQFTVSFSESYTKTLPVRNESLSTKTVRTNSTISENHQTTTRVFANETYQGWFLSVESRDCENGVVYRYLPVAFQRNHNFTIQSQTVVNSTQPTQIATPRTINNTVSEQTSTFFVSGDFFTWSSQSWPGLVDRNVFPWKTSGDNARRYFSLPITQTTLVATTSQLVTFGHTWSKTYKDQGAGAVGSATEESEGKKIGEFFQKNLISQRKTNTATVIAFVQDNDHGLASPELSFTTQNTHATVGAFMSDNAQHFWEEIPQIPLGSISQGVVGAVPLYPTFSGLISRDAAGWGLCDSSEYTSVVGSRVGQNFSTTIAWLTIEGTSTKNMTASGSFTIQSTTVASVRAQISSPTIAGGFFTPNAARTVIVSPGVLLLTTYDANTSGTSSVSYSTGTTYQAAPVGPVPVTISSFVPRVQGRGVYTQQLLDNGLP
jgi:hypothetical protein